MKKNILLFISLIFAIGILSGCCLSHNWKEATCTEPRKCANCGATEGEALGHDWKEATCDTSKICIRCGETYGEPLGHQWREATCEHPKTCTVCGIEVGECMEHSWLAATCQRPQRCAVCGLKEGGTLAHTWVSASYDTPRYCAECGMLEGTELEPAFDKREYEFNITKGTKWDYTTIAYEDESLVTGTAEIIDYRKYYSDAAHAGREGYEWREVTVEYRLPKGCKVMWGYTDRYSGLEEYAKTNFITYENGQKESVRVTEAYEYEWETDDLCVSHGNIAIQVPEGYKDLIFYVCSADYANTHRIDPNIRFFDMN